MERQTFDFILNLIANKISVSFGDMGRNTIDAKIQLLLAIWYFATPDSYRYEYIQFTFIEDKCINYYVIVFILDQYAVDLMLAKLLECDLYAE